MKNIILLIALFLSVSLHSQYYYNDIIGTREISDRMKSFNAARVHSIVATGFDNKGIKSTDFNEWQEIQNNGTILKLTRREGQNANRSYYTFDHKTRLISIRDSSAGAESITHYTYDENDHLTIVKTVTQDAGQDFNQTVERQWRYNGDKPTSMLRITNTTDSLEYRFTKDEKGNVADEQPAKRTIGIDAVYYYYDDDNRLSDIVRYDKYAKQLLPDVMFEYDENGRVAQRVTTLSTRPPNYLIWRYIFNDKGLKVKEVLFGKSTSGLTGETRAPQGRIEYEYTFK